MTRYPVIYVYESSTHKNNIQSKAKEVMTVQMLSSLNVKQINEYNEWSSLEALVVSDN